MQFRLTYEGRLLGATNGNTRAAHKHEIRRQLSPQMKRLWEVTPWLKDLSGYHFPHLQAAYTGATLVNPDWQQFPTFLEHTRKAYQAFDRHWVPLIGDSMGLTCGVDILFLRPGSRGGLLQVGDIDGRLKTLFDALAIPKSGSGLPEPEPDEEIYTLLSDDRNISQVAVETDELLQPTSPDAGQHDARIVITVHIRPLRANYLTVAFSTS